MNSFPIAATAFSRRGMYMPNFALLMFLACSTALTTAAAGKPSPTPRPQPISLKVTVNAYQQFSTSSGNLTVVTADSLGPYFDGQSGVCASLDTNGDLIINFHCTKTSTPRRLGLLPINYIAPPTGEANPYCAVPTLSPSNPPVDTNYISTWQATDTPGTSTMAFQNMAVGTTYYVQFDIWYFLSNTPETDWVLSYHRTAGSTFPGDAAKASYAQVQRTSKTEWVVEPATPSGITGAPTNVAMLVEETSGHGKSTNTECGFYTVPFSFTLDQQ